MDFQKAEKAFKEYLKNYNINDGSIALKIRHTYEVINKSEYIAIRLGLDKENIELAKIIALLHDIGRFEQIKKFDEFNDKKIEHAAFKKIMSEYEVIIHSENISCEEYYKRNGNEWIDVLVGDIQRMQLFYENGWQIKMDIPNKVWEAYEILVKRGYDRFVLKNKQDEGDKKNIKIELNKIL